MNKNKKSNFLRKFYSKREKSLINLLGSKIINFETEDVHKFRVNIKKIHAILQLLEMVEPEKFKLNGHYVIFKNLFKRFGELRDTQLNIMFLQKIQLPEADILPFKNFLMENETKLRGELSEALKQYDIASMLETGAEIKNISENIGKKKLIDKSLAFIVKESKNIEELQSMKNNADRIHKIRKHFKSLGAIAELLYNMKPLKYLKKFLRIVKRTEVKIGAWHDRVVFERTMSEFLLINRKKSKEEFRHLKNLSAKLTIENNEIADKFIPEINFILSCIIKIS